MKYMGSKSKIAKDIIPIIQSFITDNTVGYLEPFVGGANVIDKIDCNIKVGCDKQKYLIALLQNLDKLHTLPQIITKEHYSDVRDCYNTGNKNVKYEDWYIGAIGFLSSYNGRFFDGGYAGIVKTKIGNERNYYAEAKKNLENQIKDLDGIRFFNKEYNEINKNISGWVIYCDPPYKNTKQYGSSKGFNHDDFWEWCRVMSKNNIVIISEQEAPIDFKCIWEQDVNRTIDNKKSVKVTEKLFIYTGESTI